MIFTFTHFSFCYFVETKTGVKHATFDKLLCM